MTRALRFVIAISALMCVAAVTKAEPSPSERMPERAPERTSEQAPEFRLVWLFGDDDVLHAPEVSRPPSPAAGFGDRSGFDPLARDLSGRFTGRENLAFLHARAAAPGVVHGLETRAVLALGVDLSAATESANQAEPFVDLGSHLELEQRLTCASWLTLRMYPLDGDVERVGSLDALAFGGAVGVQRDSPYRDATARPRAARLSFRTSGLELFASVKTARFVVPAPGGTSVEATSYGVFTGVTSDVGEHVRLGVTGGHFEHGRVTAIDATGPSATTSGVALRASFGVGLREPPQSLLFGPDSVAPRGFVDFVPRGFAVGAEWVALGMRRARFERPTEVRLSAARGGALLGVVRAGVFEARAVALYRDPELVMRNAGGVFPGFTLPHAAAATPELTFLLAPRVLLHPAAAVGLGLSAQQPGSVMTFGFDRQGYASGATLLVRGPGDADVLPPGVGPAPVIEVRPALDLRLSPLLSLSAWVSYRRDANHTRIGADFGGGSRRGFAEPDFFGYGVALSGGQ
jgi:hypothetical protein